MRLIDADTLLKKLNPSYNETTLLIKNGEDQLNNLAEGYKEVKDLINSSPSVNTTPIIYGKWEKTVEIFDFDDFEQEAYSCSNCHVCQKPYFVFRSKYCPNCGAKMISEKGEVKEDEILF